MSDRTGLTVSFKDDDYSRIDDAAWDHKMSKNEFIRYCVAEYFEGANQERITVEL